MKFSFYVDEKYVQPKLMIASRGEPANRCTESPLVYVDKSIEPPPAPPFTFRVVLQGSKKGV